MKKNYPRPQAPQQAQASQQAQAVPPQPKDTGSVVLSAATFNVIINFLTSSEWRKADPVLRLIDKELRSRQAGNVMSAAVAGGNGEDKEGEAGPSA